MDLTLPPFFKSHVRLAPFSTFGIGGSARWLASVETIVEMRTALVYAYDNKIPYIIIGKGSNCLFDDEGFNGIVLINKLNTLENLSDGLVYAGGGYSFARLGGGTARAGWSGLEFASGIPGTVGGAIYMNAGANGSDTASRLVQVDYLYPDGHLEVFKREQLEFSYRHSPFQNKEGAIVGAVFSLESSPEAKTKQQEMLSYRTSTQPYGQKSAGCVFRNPENLSAGALIDKCGLKGFSIGGAVISPQHANFIVNSGNAKASDVLALMEHIRVSVKKKYDIELLSEICYISSLNPSA